MVEFDSPEAAAHALDKLKELELWKHKLSISYAPQSEAKKESESVQLTAPKLQSLQPLEKAEEVPRKEHPLASAALEQQRAPEAVHEGDNGLNKRKRPHPIAPELGYWKTFSF